MQLIAVDTRFRTSIADIVRTFDADRLAYVLLLLGHGSDCVLWLSSACLGFIRDWNTNSKFSHVAQKVCSPLRVIPSSLSRFRSRIDCAQLLAAIFRVFSPEEIKRCPGIGDTLNSIVRG